MKKIVVAAALIVPVALLGAARPAKAGDKAAAVLAAVAVGVGAALILDALVPRPVVAVPAPVVYQPAPPPVVYQPGPPPVVYAPAPPAVVYAPPPVVYQPAPVIVQAPPPVIITPPPVVYRTPPRVVYRPAPVVVKHPRHIVPAPPVYTPMAAHPVYGYDREGRMYWGDRYIPDR